MNTEFSLTLDQAATAHYGLHLLMGEAHDNAREHGFHKIYDDLLAAVPAEQQSALRRTIRLAKLALISSEVGEAVSALQHGDENAFAEEIADIVIRVLDLAGTENLDLGGLVMGKMMNNRRRPYLHGKEC